MGTDFVLKFTIFWHNRGFRVYLDFYAPDFSKITSSYFFFTKVVSKNGSRCFTAICTFGCNVFLKNYSAAAASESFKLFQPHKLNALLTKFSFFLCENRSYMNSVVC